MPKFLNILRLRTALENLSEWRARVDSQGGQHLLLFLFAKHSGVNAKSMTKHGEGDDKALCDTFLKVRSGDKPYYDPVVGEYRISTHYHSNMATARKNTESGRWAAAKYSEVQGEECWQFQPNYLDIFRQKVVMKAGETCKAPVFDLMTWLSRAKTFESETTLEDWLESFKTEFKLTQAEFSVLFSTVNLDGTKPIESEFFVQHKFSDALLLNLLENPAGFDLSEAISETAVIERTMPVNEDDVVSLIQNGRSQIILQGPPGTGKTYLAKRAAGRLLGNSAADLTVERLNELYVDPSNASLPAHFSENGGWTLVQFHPSYAYDDFVQGLSAELDSATRTPVFKVQEGSFLRSCFFASQTTKPFVLIIDEINRGDLSKIFGELVYALEYRSAPVSLRLSSESGRTLRIPNNLVLIGTMNSADRSISHIDYAIRRRFSFITVPPDKTVIEDVLKGKPSLKPALALFAAANQLLQDNSAYAVGHSFFLGADSGVLANQFVFQVLPLLDEYRREGILDDSASVHPEKWPGATGIPLRHQRPFELVKQLVSWAGTL